MKIVRYFLRRYPLQSVLVLGSLLLAGVLEGIGLTAVLPVLSTLGFGSSGDSESGDPSFLQSTLNDVLDWLEVQPEFWEWCAFLGIVFWLKSGVVLIAKRQVGYTVARVATDLRLGLLRSLMTARWSFYTRLPGGTAANSLATEAERGSLAFHHMAQVSGYGTEAAIYLTLAFAVSWKVSAIAIAGAAFIGMALIPLIRMAGRAGTKQTKFLKVLLTQVTDSLQAVKLLKATGREVLIEPLLERDTLKLNRALRRRVFSKEALRALQEPLIVSILLLGVVGGYNAGMATPEFLLMAGLFGKTIGSTNKMQRKYQSMIMEASALWSILELIGQAESQAEPLPTGVVPNLEREVELRNVRVTYDGTDVLDDVSLTIRAGEVTALIGESGSGKTTAADCVTGLVRPDGGEIFIDGVPLKQVDLLQWRHRIGYVPQELLMLHDTVERNVSLGDPEISERQVEEALRDSGAWEFVNSLPMGIHSSVGERGLLLSGGQRQRVAIARALVHGARLLILDEATAALDTDSEAAVWDAVERLRGKTTVLAISHQPALRGVADRVYRIENGRAQLQ